MFQPVETHHHVGDAGDEQAACSGFECIGSPGLFPDDRRNFHLARYRFALKYAHNKVVADIASGTGYGAALLGGAAKHVSGYDIDRDAVAYAKETYTADNVEFLVASGESTSHPSESIDLITSFETIEHVDSDHQLLSEFQRMLREGGRLVIKTLDSLV